MPDFLLEDEAGGVVAGVDEAGRGPWVGPVVAGCAVFLNRKVDIRLLENLNDSKKLSKKKREMLYGLLQEEAKRERCGWESGRHRHGKLMKSIS